MSETENTLDPEDSLEAFIDSVPQAFRNLKSARTKEEFDEAFASVVSNCLMDLEKDSKHLAKNDEDGLSTIVCMALNGTNILRVTREQNSNGHVDLTFCAPLCIPVRKALGEAKIYTDYPKYEGGVKQLVERYSTGREDRALLLLYVKKKGIKTHMERFRSELDKGRPCGQVAKCDDHDARWSFVSSHTHSSGEVVEIWHLGCNLYHSNPT